MNDAGPSGRGPRALPPARLLPWRLRLSARTREAMRSSFERVLSADLAWSVAFVGLSLVLLLDLRPSAGDVLRAGERVDRDVVTPVDLDVVDPVATARRREQARAAARDVYVHDTTRGGRMAADVASLFRRGRAGEPLGAAAPPAAQAALRAAGFPPELERVLATAVRHAMHEWVVANRALLARAGAIDLRHLPGDAEERVTEFDGVLDVPAAQRMAREHVLAALPPSTPGREALAELAATFVDANVSFDSRLTEARRRAAAAAVVPVTRRVPRGTPLVRAGEVVTPEVEGHLRDLAGRDVAQPGIVSLVGLLVVTSALAFFAYRYTRYHQRNFKKLRHLHALFLLLMGALLVLAEGMLWLARGVVDELGPPLDEVGLYLYVVPVAAGPILVALLANGRVAMVFAAFTAVLFGMLAGWDMHPMTWVLLVQWVGVYAISSSRARSALLRAGLIVGGAGAVLAFVVEALAHGVDPLARPAWAAGLALVGGAFGVGLVVSFALPLLESIFDVLTDIRLLELSNVNNPLLSELAVRAPGSYNHSLVVGGLAEEAAKAIGANTLFCRVAALYHDIGKVRKPEYFVENQRGENPHDRLSPSMSALVISAHVKEGIRLARESGLPEQIVDIIPQHHGTRLMTYFYEKARRAADPTLPPVAVDDFRYPGPKPRTREAAIFMLADGVEAAARTAVDASPGRLREVIRQVTNAVVLDGQLDECDLTFADLEKIQAAFLRVLVSTHHHRVEYPGFDFNRGRTERAGELAEQRVARG